MRIPLAIVVSAILLAGCASQVVHSKTNSATTKQPIALSASATIESAPIRVTLPYLFIRHGVTIRINSVEFSESQVLVNATFQETKGQEVDLQASTLMQAVPTTGQAIPYDHYIREEKNHSEPILHFAPNDQFSATLIYAPAPESTIELKFPTGKFWSSQS